MFKTEYILTLKNEAPRYVRVIKVLLIICALVLLIREWLMNNRIPVSLLIIATTAFILLALLEKQAKLSPEIRFSPAQIIFNRLMKKKFAWSEIDNVILKDGLLTVDFKNNKLFQQEIEEKGLSEEEFNNWVRKYL